MSLFILKNNFSFGFLPLDGSERADVARKGSGQDAIMNNKMGGTKEVSYTLILFPFLDNIASDTSGTKTSRWSFRTF